MAITRMECVMRETSCKSWANKTALISLCLLVFASYMGGLSNKPVAEDFDRPEANLELRPDRQFRPARAILMLAIQYMVGSKSNNPEAYHLFGLAVHIATVLAVFLIMHRLTLSQNSALAIALAFALYPRHHEAVFWVAAYTHTIMTMCLLFSFNFYLNWRRTSEIRWLLVSLILFGFAILSNEAAAIGILLFSAYELLWNREQLGVNLKRRVFVLIHLLRPFIVIVVAYISLIVIAWGGLSGFSTNVNTTFYHMYFSPDQLKDFGGYLSYMLFLFVPLRSIGSVWVKVGMLVITCVALGMSVLWGSRLVRFGVIWSIVAFLPYVLLVPFGNADRYFYLPSVGFCLAIVSTFHIVNTFIAKRFGPRNLRLVYLSPKVGHI